ncbi:MAG: hypothetical protein CMJ83_13075 [Planctomycetes bacterium]|nr:hypothetical protein [Planctomycetota bacterium]
MSGFWSLLRLDLALLRRRRLPRWIAGGALGSVVLSIAFSSAGDGEGARLVASALRFLVAVIIGLTTVLGAVSISGDAASGALRGVMLRPVGRPAVVLAHATATSLFVMAIYVTGLIIALVAGSTLCGYGDVLYEEYVVIGADEMAGFMFRLVLLPLPALLIPPLLALCISTRMDDGATAVVLALVATVGPLLFGFVSGDVPEWVFTERAMHPATVLGKLAQGYQLDADRVDSVEYIAACVWQPALWLISFAGLGILLFHRREIHT